MLLGHRQLVRLGHEAEQHQSVRAGCDAVLDLAPHRFRIDAAARAVEGIEDGEHPVEPSLAHAAPSLSPSAVEDRMKRHRHSRLEHRAITCDRPMFVNSLKTDQIAFYRFR
jgi:hypothetical protein